MLANQNADAFGLSSAVARMKMKKSPKSLAVPMTRMLIATRHHSIHHHISWSFFFLTSSGLSSLADPESISDTDV